jgi:hypothetical protein
MTHFDPRCPTIKAGFLFVKKKLSFCACNLMFYGCFFRLGRSEKKSATKRRLKPPSEKWNLADVWVIYVFDNTELRPDEN